MQLWTHSLAAPRSIGRTAAAAETAGWDGLCVVDSQNVSGDCFVTLAVAAQTTQSLGLGTAVGNSVTRTAAVNATAALSVHAVSNGRMVLGMGRGDSALAHLGRAPARLKQFEAHLQHVQRYLRGEDVPFDEIPISGDVAPAVTELELASGPDASRIAWHLRGPSALPKVLVEVAATGPRVIQIAALHADRIMFALGAEPERIAWGIETARTARKAAGLDPDTLSYGAYVNCVCHPDIDQARTLIRGAVSIFARFSVLHGQPIGPASEQTRQSLNTLHDAYDMRTHARNESPQAATLTNDFIDQFGVVGPPEHCIERLKHLETLGLDKVLIAASFQLAESEQGRQSSALFEREVLPEFNG